MASTQRTAAAALLIGLLALAALGGAAAGPLAYAVCQTGCNKVRRHRVCSWGGRSAGGALGGLFGLHGLHPRPSLAQPCPAFQPSPTPALPAYARRSMWRATRLAARWLGP
jgi:hypothetical protein